MKIKGNCPNCGEPMNLVCQPCKMNNDMAHKARVAAQCPICQQWKKCEHEDVELLRRCVDFADGSDMNSEELYDFVLKERKNAFYEAKSRMVMIVGETRKEGD